MLLSLKPVIVFLVVTEATSYCCTLPLKVTEEDEEEEGINKKDCKLVNDGCCSQDRAAFLHEKRNNGTEGFPPWKKK